VSSEAPDDGSSTHETTALALALALAKAFRPDDPTGEGMVKVRQALGLLKETVERKKRSAWCIRGSTPRIWTCNLAKFKEHSPFGRVGSNGAKPVNMP
jgi:hypothetical protein